MRKAANLPVADMKIDAEPQPRRETMQSAVRNLCNPTPDATAAEITQAMLTAKGVRLERIVSHGQASPEGFWYDQDEAEWVMVIAGSAQLQIEGDDKERKLVAGDAVYLPAHCRHRVTWTDPNNPTVWIALFLDPSLAPELHDLA